MKTITQMWTLTFILIEDGHLFSYSRAFLLEHFNFILQTVDSILQTPYEG